MARKINDSARRKPEWNRKIIAVVPFPISTHGQVHSDDERFKACVASALNELGGYLTLLEYITLKPATPFASRGIFLQRHTRRAGHCIGDPEARGTLCKIGRASCRERVSKYVSISVVDEHLKKKKKKK